MVLRTCGSDADKSRALLAISMRWKTYRPALTVRALARRADRQRRGVGPTGGGVIRDRRVVTGTLNLAFLIAAVAMIMASQNRWRCLSATPRLWN